MRILKFLVKKMIIVFALLLFLTFFLEDKAGYIQGLVGGVLYSILNLKFISYTINKAAFMTRTKAFVFTFISYSVRYFLAGLVLISVVLYSNSMFLGAFLGMLILKIAIYLSSKKILIQES